MIDVAEGVFMMERSADVCGQVRVMVAVEELFELFGSVTELVAIVPTFAIVLLCVQLETDAAVKVSRISVDSP